MASKSRTPKPAPVATETNFADFDEADFDAMVRRLKLKYFKPRELREMGAAHDSNGLNTLPPPSLWPNIETTAKAAEQIRRMLGRPIAILSAYRSAAYNRAVKGSKGSLHMQFRALDLSPFNPRDIPLMHKIAMALRNSGDPGCQGIGIYKWGIHIDNGPRRDW